MQAAARRGVLLVLVLVVLWGLWEGWHWVGTSLDVTWPFPVNDTTMPHLHDILAALWGSAIVTLPKFDAAPPLTQWGAEEVAIDLFHHAVYVTAAAAAYELL